MKHGAWGLLWCVFCVLGGSFSVAHAQSSPTPSATEPRRPKPMDDHVEDRPELDEHGLPLHPEDTDIDERKDPMTWVGLGLKVGFSTMGSSSLDNPTYRDDAARAAKRPDLSEAQLRGLTGNGRCGVIDRRCRVDGRTGLQVSVPINLGGDGFGWLFEPYVNFASTATAYGGYTGPTFNIHLADPFYLGFGFGPKAAWVVADGWDYAFDIYGRVPIHATFYLTKAFALVADLGFAFGASGYISNPISYTIPGAESKESLPQMTFGAGLNIDASLGFRFP